MWCSFTFGQVSHGIVYPVCSSLSVISHSSYDHVQISIPSLFCGSISTSMRTHALSCRGASRWGGPSSWRGARRGGLSFARAARFTCGSRQCSWIVSFCTFGRSLAWHWKPHFSYCRSVKVHSASTRPIPTSALAAGAWRRRGRNPSFSSCSKLSLGSLMVTEPWTFGLMKCAQQRAVWHVVECRALTGSHFGVRLGGGCFVS